MVCHSSTCGLASTGEGMGDNEFRTWLHEISQGSLDHALVNVTLARVGKTVSRDGFPHLRAIHKV